VRKRKLKVSGSMPGFGNWVASVIFGLAAFLCFPSMTGHADLATFLAGTNRGGENWKIFLTNSPAGSIQTVDMVFNDPIITGAINSGAGMKMPDGTKIAFRTENKPQQDTPDEVRVTKALKMGRILSVAPVMPPKDFSAGSILQRTSSLLLPPEGSAERLGFIQPAIKGKELEIATAFYKKEPVVPDRTVPTELAALVNNPQADSLATAYAPTPPDYARVSPFDSILNTEKEPGRFAPAISPDDHAWAAAVLPASVFSEEEQLCLTSGIYFESRGETVKGQAAVAQVILNRVRNPAYPDTICDVVYQNEDWRNRCQFSFACDNVKDRVWSPERWQVAKDVALAVTAGKIWLPEVGSATHYHATYVNPPWAKTMQKLARIGLHVFYRTYGGGWS
jgi:spore germination cell wall hydrolase CwlJ-like protein